MSLCACDTAPAAAVDPAAAGYTLERISFRTPRPLTIQGAPALERLVTSVLNVPHPMQYGQFVWNDEVAKDGKVWVLVNLDTQTISAFRGQHEIGTAVALYGVDGKPTPLGRFRVLERRKDHQSSIYDAEMPYTLKLTNDGIAIHGSDVRAGVGTHGCIGIPLEFASKLFEAVEVGTEVFTVRSSSPGSSPVTATATS
jgi:lipoprotein-anchoring transpeptidase ErfK/SrfK